MKKRIISFCLIITILVLQVAVPVTSFAEEQGTLSSSYGYNETPADSVTVTVNISNDGVPLRGQDAEETILANLQVTVPYFDLSKYELGNYYRYETENGQGPYISDKLIKRPTALHLYIYLLERYYLGLPEEDCGQGDSGVLNCYDPKYISYYDGELAYETSNEKGEYCSLTLTGSRTSMYMYNFWGHDENLQYYRNHRYPLMSPGWGSTADYILLSEGDRIEVAMFTNWSFYHTGAFLSFNQDEYTAVPGEDLTVTLRGTATSPVKSEDGSDDDKIHTSPEDTKDIPETPILTYTGDDVCVDLYNENWEVNETRVVNNGDGTYTIPIPDRTGTYYVMATDADGRTDGADKAPATAKIVVYDEAAAFEEIKNEAKDTIDAYKDLDDYREEQQVQLNSIIDNAFVEIDAAESEEEIEKIVADTKAEMDAVKTDEQLKAEEEMIQAFKNSKVSNLAVSISGPTVKASWKAVDGADKYQVKIYRNSKLYKTTSVKTASYQLKDATRGCKYTIKVTPQCTYDDNVYSGKAVSAVKTSYLSKASISVKKSGSYRIVKSADQNSTGYQIYIAKNKKFSKSVKKVTVTTSKGALSKKLKTTKYFKKGTNYIKVRAYTKINGKTQYGKWSTVKTVKR